jgi:hypothetical protein
MNNELSLHVVRFGLRSQMEERNESLDGVMRTARGNHHRPGMTLGVEPGSADHAPFATAGGLRLLKTATDRIITPGRRPLSNELTPRETVYKRQE